MKNNCTHVRMHALVLLCKPTKPNFDFICPVVTVQKRIPLHQQPVGIKEIMTAILQTSGPISTTESVKNSSRAFRNLKLGQFLEASTDLERLNVGVLVSVSITKGHGSASKVFIKKPPEEAEMFLTANAHLCPPDVYATKYVKLPSKAIGLQLRAKLVAMKLVAKKFLM